LGECPGGSGEGGRGPGDTGQVPRDGRMHGSGGAARVGCRVSRSSSDRLIWAPELALLRERAYTG